MTQPDSAMGGRVMRPDPTASAVVAQSLGRPADVPRLAQVFVDHFAALATDSGVGTALPRPAAERLVAGVVSAVERIADPSDPDGAVRAESELRDLGAWLHETGLDADGLRAVGYALVRTTREGAGPRWTTVVGSAWSAVQAWLTDQMLLGSPERPAPPVPGTPALGTPASGTPASGVADSVSPPGPGALRRRPGRRFALAGAGVLIPLGLGAGYLANDLGPHRAAPSGVPGSSAGLGSPPSATGLLPRASASAVPTAGGSAGTASVDAHTIPAAQSESSGPSDSAASPAPRPGTSVGPTTGGSAGTASVDPRTIPAAFSGTWTGWQDQPGARPARQQKTLVLPAGATTGTTILTTLECSGSVTVIEASATELRLLSRTTDDPRRHCVPRAYLTLRLTSPTSLTEYVEAVGNPDTTAIAYLDRTGPA